MPIRIFKNWVGKRGSSQKSYLCLKGVVSNLGKDQKHTYEVGATVVILVGRLGSLYFI